jgi:hypothetical protein
MRKGVVGRKKNKQIRNSSIFLFLYYSYSSIFLFSIRFILFLSFPFLRNIPTPKKGRKEKIKSKA